MNLDLSPLKEAITALGQALDFSNAPLMETFSEPQRNTVRAGVIQSFEFTYELAWKFMKRWLEHNLGSTYVDGVTRKQLFRLAAEHHLIDDVPAWFNYHNARNRTSHTYDHAVAMEIYEVIPGFLEDVQLLLKNLEEKND